ncbi:hypothetical protein [Marinilabilia salmonicolor]|uniref:hypothetical protein n=1 Tax=Marinilabilia salmonicolor TaxID=989 RepID=UPI00029A9027|nr:hypothetical protein [Marinilabilia salmonicolor]
MDETQQQYEKKIRKTDRRAVAALVIGLISLFAPWILTGIGAPIDSWDFTKTGQIGDTIGGVTAPFLSLVGSVLVFLSFRAQIDMNKEQFKAIKKQFERMDDETAQERYDRMQNVVNIINQRYFDSFAKTFVGQNLAYYLEKGLGGLRRSEDDTLQLYLKYSYSEVLQLGALIHLKDIMEFDQDHHYSDRSQLNFIKIQVKMILDKTGFMESYFKINHIITSFENSGIKEKPGKYHDLLLDIQSYLKGIFDLDLFCNDNGVNPKAKILD